MTNKERLSTLNVEDYTREICKLKDLSNDEIKEWLQAEYKKVFTEEEKEFARLLLKFTDFRYIARDEDGVLCVYIGKPEKHSGEWDEKIDYNAFLVEETFMSINYADKEPTSLEDIANS